MDIPNLSWKRLLVEGSAVVLSILLAFAIDAAWEQRQEEKADLEQLTGLYQELQSHKILLAEAIKAHRKTTLFGNTSFAADVMHLMVMAQASEGEAMQADQKLENVMSQLSACLSAENC